jgi:hypothetical protein
LGRNFNADETDGVSGRDRKFNPNEADGVSRRHTTQPGELS